MTLYAQYIKEREQKDIIETDKGFATYKVYPNGECYLQDIYVIPEARRSRVAYDLADQVVEIAKEKKCHTLVGSVCTDAINPTASMKFVLNYNGMKFHSVKGNMIFFTKDLRG